jgi:hypothetical protein
MNAAKILRVAWMSVLLGIGLEVVLVLAVLGFGGSITAVTVAADLGQKVSWSILVCIGLAFGSTAARARPRAMGLAGLAAAPIAFHGARAVHHGLSQALQAAGTIGVPPLALLTLTKTAQYAILGAVLGWMKDRRASLGAHAGAGLAAGVIFGGAAVAIAAPPGAPAAAIVPKMINEILFPVGCSLILYASDTLAERMDR